MPTNSLTSMTSCSGNVHQIMQTIFQHLSLSAPQLPENITTYEYQSKQKPKLDLIGRKSIDFAAGLFEGEGCLTYSATKNSWTMKIKMTDPDVIWSFYEAIGCLGSIGRYGSSPSDKPNWKPHMTWSISRKDVIFELVTAF